MSLIYVKQNTINQFVVTGRERSLIYASGGTPFYLLALHNQQTNGDVNVITPLLSSCSRYDLCRLTVSGANQNLSAGTITLLETGFYDYSLYEKQTQTTSLTNTNLLQTGLLLLSGITHSQNSFNQDFNLSVYNG
jgi:hypothetical protein